MPCLPSVNRLMLCVRPGVLDAKARRFCCVSVLMQVDLPALERPTNAISGTWSGGRNSSVGAVVRKRAVCNQPMARAAAVLAPAVAPAGEVMGEPLRITGKPGCGIVESPGFAPTNRYQDMKSLSLLL